MEGIEIALQRLAEGKCVFCGKKEYENPKKDEIKPTGWKRATISGVGGNFAAQKRLFIPAIFHHQQSIDLKAFIASLLAHLLLMLALLQKISLLRSIII